MPTPTTPLGRRITKTHTTEEATTTTHRYLYDDQNIVAILNEEQELLATILHHPDKTDTPLAITNHQTNQTYYYHRDHQGSIIALTNEEGQIVEQIEYNGHFGEIMEHTRHEVTHNPYGYTGREMDTPRLYYYRARYYSPILRLFLSPDPIEHASGDYNWYRYVGNDPVNRVDPSGLDWVDTILNGLKFFKGGKLVKKNASLTQKLDVGLELDRIYAKRLERLRRWLKCHSIYDPNYLKVEKMKEDLVKEAYLVTHKYAVTGVILHKNGAGVLVPPPQ